MSQEADRRPSVWGGGTQPDWYLGRWRLANDRCENCQPIAFFPQLWLLCFGPPGPAEVGIDPVKIEIDPSILDRFEIDSIQIMGLERQIDLTLKWS